MYSSSEDNPHSGYINKPFVAGECSFLIGCLFPSQNKKQRMMVRAAVLKMKDPRQIIKDMEKLDEMGQDPRRLYPETIYKS